MKVYGFDLTGPARGELLAADVDAQDLKVFDMNQIASSLDWEEAHTSFAFAKKRLIAEMHTCGADEDLINEAKSCKAWMVPVVEGSL